MTAAQDTIPVIASVAPLAKRYDAWLCDIWGVVHNGEQPYMEAADACIRFREQGGIVVLISNSPRPFEAVARQLAGIGVPQGCYDAIVTSGDTTRQVLAGRKDEPLFHLGPGRDKPLLEGLDVRVVDLEHAAYVLCSGLYDDLTETPDDYAEMLSGMKARELPMVCANPDLQVERGDRLIYCAGALAAAYEQIGGEVLYTGKPHPPIYELALARIRAVKGAGVSRSRVLCIGDGIKTDMVGAMAAGMDALYIASALHMEGSDGDEPLDAGELQSAFAGLGMRPVAAQKRLRW